MNKTFRHLLPLLLLPILLALSLTKTTEANRYIDPTIEPLQLYQTYFYENLYDDDNLMVDSYYSQLYITDFSYSDRLNPVASQRLSDNLFSYNNSLAEEHKRLTAFYKHEAIKNFNDLEDKYEFIPARYFSDIVIRRADTRILSFFAKQHRFYSLDDNEPDLSLLTQNYDVTTGKPLLLSDVIVDKRTLAAIVTAQLRRELPHSYTANADIANAISRAISYNDVAWTMDPEGMTLFFPPMSAGSVSVDLVSTTVLFDEYPHIFNPQYIYTAPTYTSQIVYDAPVYFDDGTGTQKLNIMTDRYGIAVYIGDDCVLRDYFDGRAYAVNAYLIKLADGRCYIYADCLLEENNPHSSSRELRVYSVNRHYAERLTTTFNLSMMYLIEDYENYKAYVTSPITDPDFFELYDPNFGTIYNCKVGYDGLPILSRS